MQDHYRIEALKVWDQTRRKAFWSHLFASLQGKKTHLLDFNAISHRLHLQNAMYRGLQAIPLTKIIGSEDRYEDFTETFLPLNPKLKNRWQHVAAVFLDPMSGGVTPIEVYKLGEAYFVKDGNHRVSVARQLDAGQIEAYVWEFIGPWDQINPDTDLNHLLLEIERSEFFIQTRLDQSRPDHTIRLTSPGGYLDLLRQIAQFQDALRQIDETEIPYSEAVAAWYDILFRTTCQIIEEAGVLALFPGRTAADLYVWLSHRRDELEQHPVSVQDSVRDLRQSARWLWPWRVVWAWLGRVLRSL